MALSRGDVLRRGRAEARLAVVAAQQQVAIAVTNVSAAPEGVLLSLVTRTRPADGDAEGPFGEGLPTGLRFGVRLPDGSQVLQGEPVRDVKRLPPPPGHHLSSLGGHAGGTFAQEDFWLWPLPGPGTLAFACAWPGRRAPETIVEVDAAALLDAATCSEELWPLVPLPSSEPPRA